jgi:glutaredoxin
MVNRSRRRTVPQIFIDNSAVSGYSELADLLDNQNVA